MNANNPAAEKLADCIGDKLGVIHRGAIWIGPKTLAVFGNDGYGSADTRSRRVADRIRAWMIYKGWSPTEVQTDSESRYTWVIVAQCSGKPKDHEQVTRRLWRLWDEESGAGGAPNSGYQAVLAYRELERIGWGYTDATLETPLKGKGGPVRGNQLLNDIMLAQADGGEDVYVSLGGVPFPAKILQVGHGPAPEGYELPSWGRELETAVLVESVGDPRSEDGGTATAYVPAGQPLMVRHFGQKHDTTDRRILIPINPATGEPLPD